LLEKVIKSTIVPSMSVVTTSMSVNLGAGHRSGHWRAHKGHYAGDHARYVHVVHSYQANSELQMPSLRHIPQQGACYALTFAPDTLHCDHFVGSDVQYLRCCTCPVLFVVITSD
jgi:hypothetical protein